MILQHCPTTYRSKPYGCGLEPIHLTKAFLDYGGRCPRCGKTFQRYNKPRTKLAPVGTQCAVTGPHGQAYCMAPVVEGPYCARHKRLNFE